MAREIKIKAGKVEAIAELNNTRTAHAIWETLPIKARTNLWETRYISLFRLSSSWKMGKKQ